MTAFGFSETERELITVDTDELLEAMEGVSPSPPGSAVPWQAGQPGLRLLARIGLVDPESLDVEFDTNFEKAVVEIERLQREEREKEPGSGEINFDVNFLLSQADALKAAAAAMQLPGRAEVEQELEKADETVGDAIVRANRNKSGT